MKQVVSSIGLEGPARRVSRGVSRLSRRARLMLHARGWTPWKPLVPEEAFSACILHAIEELRRLEPDERIDLYLELGVSRGTSMACAYHALQAAGLDEARLIGFDSFAGLPPEAAEEGWEPGAFHSTIEATRAHLREREVDLDRVTLVEGWFRDTLTDETRARLAIGRATLIMIDCDLYSASKEALAFCAPHIGDHAVIFLDDWGAREQAGGIGQKEAFEEFLREHPHLSAEPMPSYHHRARVYLLQRQPARSPHEPRTAAPRRSRRSRSDELVYEDLGEVVGAGRGW